MTTSFSLFLPLLLIAGLLAGSFLSVLIHRLHTGDKGLFLGRSMCPHCNKKLNPQELIPLISYFAQGGRCTKCKKKISWHYPILELSTGLLFVAMATTGLTPLPLYLFYGLVLLFIFFYDLLYLEVADSVMLPSILIALVASLHPQTATLVEALIGAAFFVGFFMLQIILSKGRWLGGGDLRIGAFIGLILGWKLSLVAIFTSYLIGAIVSLALIVTGKATRKTMIAFGPFLVLGTLIALFFGDQLIERYLNFVYF